MTDYTMHLGSRPKWRNRQEWRPILTATCAEWHAEGDDPISGVIRQMHAAGCDPLDDTVEIVRDGVSVFLRRPVGLWYVRTKIIKKGDNLALCAALGLDYRPFPARLDARAS